MSWMLEKLLGDKDPLDTLDFEPVVINMIDGSLVVTQLAHIENDDYCLLSPMRLHEVEDDDGVVRLVAYKFMAGCDDVFFHVKYDRMVTIGFMNDQIFKFYTEAVDRMLEKLNAAADEEKPEGNVVSFKPKGPLH